MVAAFLGNISQIFEHDHNESHESYIIRHIYCYH